MNAPHIATERSAWLLQVIGDPAVKLVALRVAVAIAHHLNGETRDAWPSQDRLAALVGSHRGNVAHAVSALVRLRHIEVEKDGRGNRYRLAIRVPGNADRQATCFPGNALSDDTTRVPENAPSASRGTREPRSGRRTNSEEQGLNSEGAAPDGASAPINELVESGESRAGAPEGARLPGWIIAAIEAAFGREPLPHDEARWHRLVDELGGGEVLARLQTYADCLDAGTIRPVPMSRWLRQGGLVEVSNVA